MAIDYTLIDEICTRLHKHPERNPLRVQAVLKLSDHAIAIWDDDSIGRGREEYLSNLLALFAPLKQVLVDRGYYSDVEVTVEPDPADDTAESPVEALSH